METHTANAQAAIQGMLENWTAAVRAQDLDGVMAHFAPEVVAFDAILQLQFKGVEAYRAHYAECLRAFPGTPIFDLHELAIVAEEHMAFAHFLVRCGAVDESGKEDVGWTRGTVCCKKQEGEWRVVHEHFSAPFDPETLNAIVNLTP